MNVDWDKWGDVLGASVPIREIKDKDGNVIGYERDEIRYITGEDEHPITRADIMREISGWKNDDGSYGDDDVHIFIAYDDGTFFANDMSGGDYREKLKKTGVIGATLMTPDYEMVWGGEKDRAGNIQPYKTWVTPYDESEGKEGHSNWYSGYKTVGEYRVRERVTYNHRFSDGRYGMKKEVIRKSKVRKVDW